MFILLIGAKMFNVHYLFLYIMIYGSNFPYIHHTKHSDFTFRWSVSWTTKLSIRCARSIWSTATTTWSISSSSRSISASKSNNVSAIWWSWGWHVSFFSFTFVNSNLLKHSLNYRNAPPATGAPPPTGGDPYRGYPGTPGSYPPPPQRPYNPQQPTPNTTSATPPTSGAPPQNPPGSPYPPQPQQFDYRSDQVCWIIVVTVDFVVYFF